MNKTYSEYLAFVGKYKSLMSLDTHMPILGVDSRYHLVLKLDLGVGAWTSHRSEWAHRPIVRRRILVSDE